MSKASVPERDGRQTIVFQPEKFVMKDGTDLLNGWYELTILELQRPDGR